LISHTIILKHCTNHICLLFSRSDAGANQLDKARRRLQEIGDGLGKFHALAGCADYPHSHGLERSSTGLVVFPCWNAQHTRCDPDVRRLSELEARIFLRAFLDVSGLSCYWNRGHYTSVSLVPYIPPPYFIFDFLSSRKKISTFF
jgi:hypothetical protein